MTRSGSRIAMTTRLAALCLLLVCASSIVARPQERPAGTAAASTPAAPAPERPVDSLGRDTPRGTVLGFLAAARKGENEVARLYLNTGQNGSRNEDLAHQLFVVLDARLPARLSQVSDAPDGSRANPLAPDDERVGTISGPDGPVDIILERVTRAKIGQVWLFSSRTLASIPGLYVAVTQDRTRLLLPRALTDWHIGGVRPFDWFVLLLGLVGLYVLTVLLNRVLSLAIGGIWRRFSRSTAPARDVLPLPARLLLMTLSGRWLLAKLPLSLLVRQFLSTFSSMILIVVLTWLGIVLCGEVERHVCRRIPAANFAAGVSLLRVGRRIVDLLVIFVALIATLRHFGVDPTPVLAGLGVGGLAVALAAQKTLENVIAGASLIFDQAVRVGDFLKVGEVQGTVDNIGLRSTRIRTLDRTVVTVPNGQIANMVLETLSARDKFWFHPVVALRYETSGDQMQLVTDRIRAMLAQHPAVDHDSVRVRFLRMGAFSLDVEIFAYVFARDWVHFLEIQERLLFGVMEIVSGAGTAIAFPSQTMYVGSGAPALLRDR
jgi:MscS family membrane protein